MNDPRQDYWRRAIESFGTAALFEERAKRLGRRLNLITFSGIAVPAVIGASVATYGVTAKFVPILLGVGGLLLIGQLVASIWAVIRKWQEQFAYAHESAAVNRRLSARYERLAKELPQDAAVQFQMLELEYSGREDQDSRQGVSEPEKRRGMRAALRKFQRKCVGCGAVPVSMEPSKCDVCGNF